MNEERKNNYILKNYNSNCSNTERNTEGSIS